MIDFLAVYDTRCKHLLPLQDYETSWIRQEVPHLPCKQKCLFVGRSFLSFRPSLKVWINSAYRFVCSSYYINLKVSQRLLLCRCLQIEPLIQNREMVHHLLLYRCPLSVASPSENQCFSGGKPDECFQPVAVWGVGGGVSDGLLFHVIRLIPWLPFRSFCQTVKSKKKNLNLQRFCLTHDQFMIDR